MHSKILLSIALLLTFSCGKEPDSNTSAQTLTKSSASKTLEILPEVQSYFDSMNEYITVYLKEAPVDNIVFKYIEYDNGLLEMEARGYCDKTGTTPVVYIYKGDWSGPYAISNLQRTASFYHLVGHCAFNKEHDDRVDINSGRPYSFMHSNFKKSMFGSRYSTGESLFTIDSIRNLQREYFDYHGPL